MFNVYFNIYYIFILYLVNSHSQHIDIHLPPRLFRINVLPSPLRSPQHPAAPSSPVPWPCVQLLFLCVPPQPLVTAHLLPMVFPELNSAAPRPCTEASMVAVDTCAASTRCSV